MRNIMMLCHSAGFEHSYLPNAEVAIKELARETGLFNVVTTHRCEKLTPEASEANDVLIFATTGDLPFDDTQKQSLLDFVKNGKGFLGIHVMYSGLGRPDELWSLPWHRQHILGCIKWAAGIEK